MPQGSQEEAKPTRMELLRLKKRVDLAEKGRDLLKEKRDALVMEFFDSMRLVQEKRQSANRILERAYRSLTLCYAAMGSDETRQISTYTKAEIDVSLGSKNIMGVIVPTAELGDVTREVAERGYSLVGGSIRLDEAAEAFEEALQAIVDLAAAEETARKVASELEKTKRRVSALDNVVVPGLRGTIKMIEDRLEELERENFSRLKKIKSILTERESEA